MPDDWFVDEKDDDDDGHLLWLIKKGVCFFGSVWNPNSKTTNEKDFITIGVYVMCNDLFYWACADAEGISHGDINELYEMVKRDPVWGSAVWCCRKRNLQPQAPIRDDMIAAGAWTAELAALPMPEPS